MVRITHVYSYTEADVALREALKNGMNLNRTATGLTQLDIVM